jgi:hypothetical protein
LTALIQFPFIEQLAGQIISGWATVKNDRLIAASLRVASDDRLPSESFLFPEVDKDDDVEEDEDDEEQ